MSVDAAVTTGLRSFYLVLAEQARARPDAPALVIGEGLERATYAALHGRVLNAAAHLRDLGVQSGDRVAVWLPNGTNWVVAAFAAARLGAVLVPINTRWTEREAAQLLSIVSPRLLVIEKGRGDATSPGLSDVPVLRVATGAFGTDAVDTALTHNVEDVVSEPTWVASAMCDSSVGAVLATSGTTSRPKAVMLRHRSLTRLAANIARRQGLGPADRLYTIAPFYHCSGLVHGLLVAFSAGCCLYATPKYHPAEVGRVMRGEQVTSYHGFALPLREAAGLPGFDPSAYAALRGAWFSAPADDMAGLEARYRSPMCELYGLTECGGNAVMTAFDDDIAVRYHTDGYPHPGIEVDVFETGTSQRVDVGATGEIRIRGWNVMLGYFGDAAATARALDDEGWLRTGDIGRRDPDGNIAFLARNDDMIRVGGENVSPAEVEDVIAGHPAVAETSVIGVDDERLGSVLVAFVVPEPGTAADATTLREHCVARLAPFKVPREFISIDALPKTGATLRVQRSVLRERYASRPLGEETG